MKYTHIDQIMRMEAIKSLSAEAKSEIESALKDFEYNVRYEEGGVVRVIVGSGRITNDEANAARVLARVR